MGLREAWRNADKRAGHFRVEFLAPVSRIADWLKNHSPRKGKMVWEYDGCG